MEERKQTTDAIRDAFEELKIWHGEEAADDLIENKLFYFGVEESAKYPDGSFHCLDIHYEDEKRFFVFEGEPPAIRLQKEGELLEFESHKDGARITEMIFTERGED